MKLKKVETLFNELFDFDNLIKDATQYIEKTLLESDINFLSEDGEDDTELFKELKVEYNRTNLLVNNIGNMPYFRLEFYLFEDGNEIPKYTYEIEYTCSGEFSDEYFLEY